MSKRIAKWFLIAIVILFSLSLCPFFHAQSFQLTCPIGLTNINPVSPTFNPTNNKYIQWLCVDPLGNVTIQNVALIGTTVPGAGVTPGTPQQFAIYNGATTVTSDPNLDDSLTTANVITSKLQTNVATPANGTIQIGILGNLSGATNNPAINFISSNGISGGIISGQLGGVSGPGLVPTISGAGTAQQGGTGGVASPISIVRINQGLNAQSIQNFNDSIPVATTNGKNVSWQRVTNANGNSISAQLVGDGNPAHSFTGTGTFAQSAQSVQNGSCTGSTTTCTLALTGLPSAFSSTPSCSGTPTTSNVTSFFISTLTTTTVTFTYAPSGTVQFSIVCVGNGQP